MSEIYITPIIKLHSSFAEAKKFFDEFGGIELFRDEEKISISDVAQGKRNLIIGEPGVGKTKLLEKTKKHFDEKGTKTALIFLKERNAIEKIDEFLKEKIDGEKILFLDALDEVQSNIFPEVLQKIEKISKEYPDVAIYLSARWVFINKYANSFPNYRFVTISPFTQSQVREYLIAAGRSEEDVDILLHRIMPFNHRMLVIQIPRYLFFLNDFLEKKGINAAAQISRNELFEYFIYSKLEVEEKLDANKRAITKRVLEKLALTMEIYQTNVITQDELMTFFDDLKSDLKTVALSQISLDVFFGHSLLKVSQEDLGKIEFENTEFQEYLAAKEITRFSDPNRAAFGFAVDQNINEIHPTWFNTLTFLVDMQQGLLEQLMEFSGIHSFDKFKVIDDGFLTFLSRINPKNISSKLKQRLFTEVLLYHQIICQWIPGQLASAAAGFFDQSLEPILKKSVEESKLKKGAKRFVPLGNVAYIIGHLLEQKIPISTAYWRKELISYVADKNENGVLQRHALFALGQLKDPSVVDEFPDLTNFSEELVVREFILTCVSLNPDNERSLEYFISATKRDEFYGRYGFFAIKKSSSIKKFLEAFNNDEDFRKEFLKDSSLFNDKDVELVKNIEKNFDDEIGELCKEVLAKAINYHVTNISGESSFIVKLWKLLKKKYPEIIPEMIDRIHKNPDGKTSLYFLSDFLTKIIKKEDVDSYIEAMIKIGEKDSAISLMMNIKFSKIASAQEIYEEGRKKLPKEYAEWEAAQKKAQLNGNKIRERDLLKEFRALLEPSPGKFSNDVFAFFVRNFKELGQLIEKKDKNRLIKLLTGTIFKFVDPGEHKLTITEEHQGAKSFTTSSVIHFFGDAIEAARLLDMDLTPYRQKILNYIPFSYDKHLQTILDIFKNVTPEEIKPVLDIYRNRKTDLWRHQIPSFVEAVEQYHIIEAAPILRGFVKESICERYARERSLIVSDALTKDISFLKKIVKLYKKSKNEEDKILFNIANGLLITAYADRESIEWRLKEIATRAVAFIEPRGCHSVGAVEDEISHGKSFAKPLMEFKQPGFEKEYLHLLDEAMKLWAKGKDFYAYAGYIWDIVYAYFDNLKENGSYAPLRSLEDRVAALKERSGANWLASRMVNLRRAYLGNIGKPKNISEVIKKYNNNREFDNKKIENSEDLFSHTKDALDTDLKYWIEDEGAYDLIIGRKLYTGKKQDYEKLIQKTLKTQIENIFFRRGLQIDIIREPQLIDEKRIDFLIRYGFVGPIILEIKLASNSDIKGNNLDKKPSYESMCRYMGGYGSSHGIFMVIDNIGSKNLMKVKNAYEKIPNVIVRIYDCYNLANSRRMSRKKNTKKR